MVLKELLAKLKQKHEVVDNPDDLTTDKYLRSLRRQRRVQMEEVEKKVLQKKIKDFEKARERKHLWGVNKGNALLNAHNPYKKGGVKVKRGVKKGGFFGKYHI